jgi:hypothetical protein
LRTTARHQGPEGVFATLRKVALGERRKIDELLLKRVDAALRKRPTIDPLNTKTTKSA